MGFNAKTQELSTDDKHRLEDIWRRLWEEDAREANAERWHRALMRFLYEKGWVIVDKQTLEVVYFDLSSKDKP